MFIIGIIIHTRKLVVIEFHFYGTQCAQEKKIISAFINHVIDVQNMRTHHNNKENCRSLKNKNELREWKIWTTFTRKYFPYTFSAVRNCSFTDKESNLNMPNILGFGLPSILLRKEKCPSLNWRFKKHLQHACLWGWKL
jgi:hypothetical protein